MNYLTNYYKNLCEQLEYKVSILEAGLKQALRSNEPEKIKKEMLRQGHREDIAQAEYDKSSDSYKTSMSQKAAGKAHGEGDRIKSHQKNYEKLKGKLDAVGQEDDDVNNDGKVNDTDSYLLHRREVITNNIKPYASPSEMASFKLRTGKDYNQY